MREHDGNDRGGADGRIPSGGGHAGRGIAIGVALRALPLEIPPNSAWPAIAEALRQRRRRRVRLASLAAAALLLVALALPSLLQRDAVSGADAVAPMAQVQEPGAASTQPASAGELARLMHESAQLEAVIAATADPGVGTGAALMLQAQLHGRMQMVDALLGSAPADPATQRLLWQERVVLLRRLAALEGGEQLLAAHGSAADSTLVMTF